MEFLDMNDLDHRAKSAGVNKVLMPVRGTANLMDGEVENYIQFVPYYLRKGVAWLPFKKMLRSFIFIGRESWDDEKTYGLWCQIVYDNDYNYVLCFPHSVKDVIGSDVSLTKDDVIMVTFVNTKEQIANMSQSKGSHLRCKAHLFRKGVLDKEWFFESEFMGLRNILRDELYEDDEEDDEDEVVGISGRDGTEFHCHPDDCAYCFNEDCSLNYYYDW